ncbi:NF-kappa-B inhibitor cactus-like [Vespa mandarinia]|uniref:NF-kappa-B inhibitor cactus-like n=1 Tax=Vespa mandarinia TaxID=7446 RepID=UPI001612AB09|nr:NF-kappa-B inhibitor cactus-like [Vespa mandarinia]
MWYSSSGRNAEQTEHRDNVADNITEEKWQKEREDSGRIDSGFLSGGNLQISSELDCSDLDVIPDIGAVAPEPMRADSGVDLGLSESLSQLTLKQVTLNPLASGKVQTEPTIELVPLADHKIGILEQQQLPQGVKVPIIERNVGTSENHEKRINNDEPWQLYYTQDDEGDTQLHIAIVQGFLEAAFSLIRMAPHPCLLDILNDDGQSPLHLAVLTRQPRIVRRLILAGANPSLRNFRGNTALHLTCETGDLSCAKALTDPLSPVERNYLLLGKKIPALPQNLEQRNYDGEMCLHIAASGGQVELVRLLVRLGADLEAREALSGKTALHLAVERGCRSVVSFLLHECRPCLDTPTYAGITVYQYALCFDGQLARELVRLGATPEPLPETDSDESDDEDGPTNDYLPPITRLKQQNVVGVRV